MKNFSFNVSFMKINEEDKCPLVTIETDAMHQIDSFCYSNIKNMYNTDSTQGHGIQVKNLDKEKPLMEMCDKIAQAVYDYEEKIGYTND